MANYAKFERLLNESGKTIFRVANDLSLPASTLYEWKAGKYTPKADKLAKIANYFGVSLDWFYQ